MSPDPRPAPSIANRPTEPPLLTATIGAALQDGVEAPARQQPRQRSVQYGVAPSEKKHKLVKNSGNFSLERFRSEWNHSLTRKSL